MHVWNILIKSCDSQENEVGGVDTGHSEISSWESETFLPQPPIFKEWTNGVTGNAKNSEKAEQICMKKN